MRFLIFVLLLTGCDIYSGDRPGRTVYYVELTVCERVPPEPLYECTHFDAFKGDPLTTALVVDPIDSYIHHVSKTEIWRGKTKIYKGGRLAVCDKDSPYDRHYTCQVFNAHRKMSHYSESVERPVEKYMNE